jgi:hypothetical protein
MWRARAYYSTLNGKCGRCKHLHNRAIKIMETITNIDTLFHRTESLYRKYICTIKCLSEGVNVKFSRYRPSRPLGTRKVKASGFSRLSAL